MPLISDYLGDESLEHFGEKDGLSVFEKYHNLCFLSVSEENNQFLHCLCF